MITINTNMASIIAQNSFNKSSNSMNRALERLSTGYKINSSKDDAAGNAIATKLETKISSYAQATKNAEMGADYLQSADSTITTMQNMVQRMRDLTEQAANGTYGDDERKAMQAEVDGLRAELYRIKNSTEMNGKNLFGTEEFKPSEPVKPVNPDFKPTKIVTPDIPITGKTAEEIKTVLQDIITNPSPDKKIGISTSGDVKNFIEAINSIYADDENVDTSAITVALTNSIDMSGVTDFFPILKFSGEFYGNGNSIENLVLPESAAFIIDATDAVVQDIALNNVTTTGEFLTPLLAFASGDIKIDNCHVSGTMHADYQDGCMYYSGTLVDTVEGNLEVTNCSINCNVVLDNCPPISTIGNVTWCSAVANSVTGNMKVSGCNITGTLNGAYTHYASPANNVVFGTMIYGNLEIKDTTIDVIFDSSNSYEDYLGGHNYPDVLPLGYYFAGELHGDLTIDGLTYTKQGNISAYSVTGPSSVVAMSVVDPNYESIEAGQRGYIEHYSTAEVMHAPIMRAMAMPMKAPTMANAMATPQTGTAQNNSETAINLQVGIQADANSVISIDTGFTMGEFNIDLSSDASAQASLVNIDAMMDKMTAKKTDIGASLNRLESVMAQQEAMRTSMTSALSQIKDADIAKESANYIKNQILQQTTASLLATANQNPNIALNLL